jgi:tRNA(Ile)-lysidine synthase
VNIVDTIRENIERHHLIPEGSGVVAAVSGGADSVALLYALQALEIPCTVAHLNHNLRGAASTADEQFVRELARELALPIVAASVDVEQAARTEGLSVEMAARKARHDFFSSFGKSVIALAHQADDQAETFLLRLARGAGPEGLGGMSFSRQLGSLRLIRPMLNIPRTALLEWLKTNGISWREDASNADESYLRNRVRHTVLPLLQKELNPNIRDTILRTMDILRAENEWMDETIAPFRLPAADMPIAARRRMLRKWLFEHGVKEAGFEAVDAILSLMDDGNGTAVFELNALQRVVVEYGFPRIEQGEVTLPHPEWVLHIEAGTGWKKDHGRGAGMLPATASFDADRVGTAAIEVRNWKPGDSMAPLGMEGCRKLQDIFTDQKIPRSRRGHIPVVVCRGEIIWIPGYRTARGWEVQSELSPSIHVHIEQKHAE